MKPLREIAGVEVYPVTLGGGPLRVSILRAARAPLSGAVEREWARISAANPRAFDGPVLSVLSYDPASNHLSARRDTYARLAVQPAVHTGVRILSVTGVLTARDAGGREHVLLGRRGEGVRVYERMWELGPSGGVHTPPDAVGELDEDALFATLADEVEEEVGLRPPRARAVAVCRDHVAMSDDIVFACDLGALEEAGAHAANWEYGEVLWMPTDALAGWEAAHEAAIIAPTRALFRALGWICWS